jgi:elongation factor Ts
MEITAQMVSRLREQTGAGMMECKKALVECEGDVDKARDFLRAKGKAGAEKRAGRAAADGVVAACVTPEGAAMVELNSETDFVARNDDFRACAQLLAETAAGAKQGDVAAILSQKTAEGAPAQQKLDDVIAKLRENIVFRRAAYYPASPETIVALYLHTVTHKIGVLLEVKGDPNDEKQVEAAKGIAMHIAASKPEYVRREDVPAEVVERERQVLADLTRNEGKPEAAIPKIVEGRLGKFYERACLVDQPYVREPGKTVGQVLSEAGLEARRFTLYVVGQE